MNKPDLHVQLTALPPVFLAIAPQYHGLEDLCCHHEKEDKNERRQVRMGELKKEKKKKITFFLTSLSRVQR